MITGIIWITSRLTKEKIKVDAELVTLQAEINSLTNDISAATAAGTNGEEDKLTLTAKQTELAEKQKEVARIDAEIGQLSAATAPAASKRFIDDILSDDNGVSFHRFQIFGWTSSSQFTTRSRCRILIRPYSH
jgi:hypothetical protein